MSKPAPGRKNCMNYQTVMQLIISKKHKFTLRITCLKLGTLLKLGSLGSTHSSSESARDLFELK